MKSNHSPIYDAVRRAFGGRSGACDREWKERLLEDKVVDYFSGAGIPVRRQVYCGAAGRADIVTPDTIFELKDELSCRRVLQQALGQMLLYRSYLGHRGKAAIICNSAKISRLPEIVGHIGVEVYVWPSDVEMIVCDPPFCGPHWRAVADSRGGR